MTPASANGPRPATIANLLEVDSAPAGVPQANRNRDVWIAQTARLASIQLTMPPTMSALED